MEQSYKEKYEKALEKIKNFIDKDHNDINVDDILNVFPELAESEDERIRNGLVRLLKELLELGGVAEDEWDRNECEKYIDWLEKQPEQNQTDKIEPKFKVGDKIYLKPEYRMPNDDTPIANTVKEIRRIDDKHYRFDGSYIFIEDQDKYELVEQKPEENKGNIGGISPNWSEEDEQHVNSLLKRLQGMCKKGATYTATRFAVSQDIEWLKSLKERKGGKI